jgi:hypothetical protein
MDASIHIAQVHIGRAHKYNILQRFKQRKGLHQAILGGFRFTQPLIGRPRTGKCPSTFAKIVSCLSALVRLLKRAQGFLLLPTVVGNRTFNDMVEEQKGSDG